MITPVTGEREKQLRIEKGNKQEEAIKVECCRLANDTKTRIIKTERKPEEQNPKPVNNIYKRPR